MLTKDLIGDLYLNKEDKIMTRTYIWTGNRSPCKRDCDPSWAGLTLEEFVKEQIPQYKCQIDKLIVLFRLKDTGGYARGIVFNDKYFIEIGGKIERCLISNKEEVELIKDNVQEKITKLRMIGKLL